MNGVEYFIIEHPTRGVLYELDWTDSEKQFGRFSWAGMRNDERVLRFGSVEDALRAKGRIAPASLQVGCEIRGSQTPGGDREPLSDAWGVIA